jgi:hypothetical protein
MTIYCTTNTRFKAAESPPPSGYSALDDRASGATLAKPDIEREFSGGGRFSFWNSARCGLATGQQRQRSFSEAAKGFHLHRGTPLPVDHAPLCPVRVALPGGRVPRPQAARGVSALRPLPGWSVSTDKWYHSLLVQRFSTQPLAGEPPWPTVESPKPSVVDPTVDPLCFSDSLNSVVGNVVLPWDFRDIPPQSLYP